MQTRYSVRFWAGTVFPVLMAGWMLGCGSGGVSDQGSGNEPLFRFELTGVGHQLMLEGAPLDPEYRAMYPNPNEVADMVVSIFGDGTKQASCGNSPCEDSPFFVQLRDLGQGQDLGVWDMYGKLVARHISEVKLRPGSGITTAGETERSGRTGGSGAAPGGTGNQQEPNKPAKMKSGKWGSLNEMQDWGWLPDSLKGGYTERFPGTGNVPGTGTGTGPTVPMEGEICEGSQQQRVCDLINKNLEKYDIDYVFDCARLAQPTSFVTGPELALPRKSVVPCHDIVPYNEVTGVGGASCGGFGMTNLLNRANQILMKDAVCLTSPLVLDLDGNGVRGTTLATGVTFDLMGNGEPLQCSWPEGENDAFLVQDRNGNGAIDSATELFGNATGGENLSDGFAALAKLDDNHDGVVDARDEHFSSLALWRDKNHDGISQAAELTSLVRENIAGLGVTPVRRLGIDAADGNGNAIPLRSVFIRGDGSRGALVDLFLQTGTIQRRQ